MTSPVILELPRGDYSRLWSHLLPEQSFLEQAAFAYVEAVTESERILLRLVEWQPVPSEGFVYQSEVGFELTDEMKAAVIKHAHDLKASVVEFHSHSGPWPAKFSPSDLYGFSEFVPHVWWRLKHHPYVSVVVTQTGFDALAWIAAPGQAQRLDAIDVEGERLKPTNLSPLAWDKLHYDKTLRQE